MRTTLFTRALIVLAAPVAMLGVAPSASAEVAAAGVKTVEVSSRTATGTVTGRCAFTTTLPSTTSVNEIPVDFTGTAQAVGNVKTGATVAVSTSLRCFLRSGATGSAGITLPGAAAAITGTGVVQRLAPNPEICTTVSAAFSDGNIAEPTTNCTSL